MTNTICPDAFISPFAIEEAVVRALAEDFGRAGDVTSVATVPAGVAGRAVVAVRESGVVSGLPLVEAAFRKLDADVRLMAHVRDGDVVASGTVLMTVTGSARGLLGAERTALNFLGHLSGIATATAAFVQLISGTRARVCCTRKTTPGLRALQKYAVRCGGGFNHRFGLDDAILIKDNHIAVAGGIASVLRRARAAAGHLVKIEIEVDTLQQLREVLDTGLADVVLLDNMSPAILAEAVGLVAGRLVTEASGGITHASAAAVAATGVDYLSSGAITHSSVNLDVGLDIEM
jgi:nicotinate-nucleotide pyrophosphorylase (carboxylating)